MVERSLLCPLGIAISLPIAGCAELVGADFDDPRARQSVEEKSLPSYAAYLKAPAPQPEANFGYTLALDATGLLATAPFENNGSLPMVGATYYFDFTQPDQPPVRIVVPYAKAMDGQIPDEATARGFSEGDWGSLRVAISEQFVVIGVPTESGSNREGPPDGRAQASGAVYVYERGNLAEPVQRIKAPKIETLALFGSCVSLSDSRLAVGAAEEDNPGAPDSGAVYVYELRDGRVDTSSPSRLRPDVAHDGDQLGSALEIEGDLLVVGAPGESSKSAGIDGDPNDTSLKGAGAAYVYHWSHEEWRLEAYVKPQLPVPFGVFGVPISIADGRFVVGAVGNSSGCPENTTIGGAAYVVGKTDGVWAIEQCLSSGSGRAPVFYGGGLAMRDNRLVVGAAWDNSGLVDDPTDASQVFAGAAYIYDRDASGVWIQRQYVKAPNVGANDVFGVSVALTPERLVIGAPQESGGESGRDANLLDDSAHYAGAAYVFSRDSR